MIVLVCGGRDFTDRQLLDARLDLLHASLGFTRLVHGAARGADRMAAQWAKSRSVPQRAYPADWERYGPRIAGPIRNQEMLDSEHPDLVVAFPGGNGTRDMVRRAIKAGVEVVEIG